MTLPTDVINIILSYGDVIVTEKYKRVLCQLDYFIKEFNYQRLINNYSSWFDTDHTHFKLFAFMKTSIERDLAGLAVCEKYHFYHYNEHTDESLSINPNFINLNILSKNRYYLLNYYDVE